MRIILEWIKANIISVISIAVVVVSLGFMVWIPMLGGKSGFRDELRDRRKMVNRINALMTRSIPWPAKDPDAPPGQILNVTINKDVLEKRSVFYDDMAREYTGVFTQAVQFNQRGHEPMLEGVFPTPRDGETPFEAKAAYRESFDDLFGAYDPDQPDRPRLHAGMPPTAEELQLALDQVRNDYVATVSEVEMTRAEIQSLTQEMRDRLIDLLKQRAEQIHIYARIDVNPSMNRERFPFYIGGWAFLDSSPQPHQLWEGQLELWIQQDLVRAIALANHVADPDANVLTAPVKRLIKMRVVPGYVGLHTLGAAADTTFNNPQRTDDAYPPPLGGVRTNTPNRRQSDNFYVGPSGRVSNALYDVRHVVLEVDVDSQRLSELLTALSSVNFMTVLNLQIKDVDEYEALRKEGYLYGEADVVRATLVIESIWLRQWTEPMMPPRVRSYVGIDEPETDTAPGNRGMQGMPRGFGPPGMPGGPMGPY